MPNDMEHERRRFREMNVRQLWTRLGRITDVTKLRNFVRLCDEYASAEYRSLKAAAENKLNERLGVREETPRWSVDPFADAHRLQAELRQNRGDRHVEQHEVGINCPRCGRSFWRDRDVQMFDGRMHCNDCVAEMVKVRRQLMLKEKPKEKIRVIRLSKKGGRK